MKREKLIDRDDVYAIVCALGEQISRDYEGKNLLLLCVLKGAIIFLSDLMREITIPLDIGFLEARSYGNNMFSNGKVKINLISPSMDDLKNFDVVVVEDIVDTETTVKEIKKQLEGHCKSLRFASLLIKDKGSQYPIEYPGFLIPDVFVVGYGLDAQNQFRNLPDIEVVY